MMGFKRWAAFLPAVALLAFTALALVDYNAKSGQAEAAVKQDAQQQPKAQDAKQEQPKEIERITVDELILMLAKKKPVVIIDARNPDSYDRKIKGALQIPVDETEARLKEIPRDKEIVIYCA